MPSPEPFGDRLAGDPEFGGNVVHSGPTRHVEVPILDARDERVVLFVGKAEMPPSGGVRQLVNLSEVEGEVSVLAERIGRRQRVAVGKEHSKRPSVLEPGETEDGGLPSVNT